MRCVRCGRPLTHPAKTIDSKHGPLMWGPVCALKSGLIEPRPRGQAQSHTGASEADPRQLALDMEESRDA